MKTRLWQNGVLLSLFGALALIIAGCGPADNKGARGKKRGELAAEKKGDHSGWWCDEHGIPEDDCSMCSAKVAAECKKNGDWCKEHDRAKSQCFKCDPKLKEKFAAQYRAKFGKEPPPTEDEEKKEEKKG